MYLSPFQTPWKSSLGSSYKTGSSSVSIISHFKAKDHFYFAFLIHSMEAVVTPLQDTPLWPRPAPIDPRFRGEPIAWNENHLLQQPPLRLPAMSVAMPKQNPRKLPPTSALVPWNATLAVRRVHWESMVDPGTRVRWPWNTQTATSPGILALS